MSTDRSVCLPSSSSSSSRRYRRRRITPAPAAPAAAAAATTRTSSEEEVGVDSVRPRDPISTSQEETTRTKTTKTTSSSRRRRRRRISSGRERRYRERGDDDDDDNESDYLRSPIPASASSSDDDENVVVAGGVGVGGVVRGYEGQRLGSGDFGKDRDAIDEIDVDVYAPSPEDFFSRYVSKRPSSGLRRSRTLAPPAALALAPSSSSYSSYRTMLHPIRARIVGRSRASSGGETFDV